MELPAIETIFRDAAKNITYTIVAYRTVSSAEAILSIRSWLATQKRKPKAGSAIKIVTLIGATD